MNLHSLDISWQPIPVFLPGKSHGWRSLVGCNPWGHKELDATKRLHFHLSLSCTGEGNGNPLQCSYLENPRDGGAWWAAVYGVAQSQTRLKQLSSSSSSLILFFLALGLTCLLCVSTRMKASQRPERCFVHCYIPEPRAIINV